MTHAVQLTSEQMERAHRIDHTRSLRVVGFVGLWVLATATSVMWVGQGMWPVALVSVLVSAASLHGISLFTHEGVHGVLSPTGWVNDGLAALCAWPVLQNYRGYRVLHLRHHANLGDAGDPDHYANYTRWTWGIFLMNWGRLLLGYPAYITLIPILGFKHGTREDRIAIVVELVCAGLLLLALVSLLPAGWFLWGWVLPMVCINTMVNIRGMSQHTLLAEPTHPVRGSRCIRTSPLVRFFMCNENYHLEHHLYPGVPWYNLPYVHGCLREAMEADEAPVIEGYSSFVWTFVTESWHRGPFGTPASD